MGEEINVETYPLSRRHGQSEKIGYSDRSLAGQADATKTLGSGSGI
jgi:hypothetical protein